VIGEGVNKQNGKISEKYWQDFCSIMKDIEKRMSIKVTDLQYVELTKDQPQEDMEWKQ